MSKAEKALRWKRTTKTDRLVVYTAGEYRIEGKGVYGYGNRLIRIWSLWRGDVSIGSPNRLEEAKRDAAYDLANRKGATE